MNVNKTAKGTVFIFVATFIGLGISYFFGVLVARFIGPSSYGQFSLGLTLFNVIAILSVFGLDNAILKYMPEYSNKDQVNNDINLLLSGLIIGGVISVILSFLFYLNSEYLSNKIFNDEDLSLIFKYFSIGIPAYVLTTISLSMLQAKHNIYLRISIKYFSEPLIKILIAGGLLFIGLEIEAAILAFVFSLWFSLILCYIGLRRNLNISSFSLDEKYGVRSTLRNLFTYSSPLLIGLIFITVANRSDFILLGYMKTSFDVGLYAAAFQTTAIIVIVLQSVESIVAPHISEALNTKEIEKINNIYTMSLRWVVILGVPLFVIFITQAKLILSIFGEEFVAATTAFVVLATGHFINLTTGSSNYILLFLGRTKLVMLNQIINSILIVLLNVLLINEYGILGAAISMLVATLVVNVIRIVQVYRILNIHPYELYLLKPVVAGILLYVVVLILNNVDIVYQVPLIFLSILLYVVGLVLLGMREFDKQILLTIFPLLNKLNIRGFRSLN